MPIRFAFLAFLLVAVGCDSGEDAPSLRAPGGRTPTAGAIEVRDENNVRLGVFGSGPIRSGRILTGEPDPPGPGGEAIPASDFVVSAPFPNPFWRGTTVTFALGGTTEVQVFVVAALPPGRADVPPASEQGAWVYRPGGLPIAVLSDGPRTAGFYQVDWDPTETLGRTIPFGYYRIYVQTPYAIAWQDVLYTPDSPYNF
jgi:hypothetical protein